MISRRKKTEPPKKKRQSQQKRKIDWSCEACTYRNTVNELHCEMCDTPRKETIDALDEFEFIAEPPPLAPSPKPPKKKRRLVQRPPTPESLIRPKKKKKPKFGSKVNKRDPTQKVRIK